MGFLNEVAYRKSIQGGEDVLGNKVGHKYEVLHKFYLEKDAPQQIKADLGLQNPVMIKSNDVEAEETYSNRVVVLALITILL